MLENNSEKVFKNREKPINTGVLRFLVYEAITISERPITISQILEKIALTGHYISRRTVQNTVEQTFLANDYSRIKIQSIVIHSGAKSRARAFYFVHS